VQKKSIASGEQGSTAFGRRIGHRTVDEVRDRLQQAESPEMRKIVSRRVKGKKPSHKKGMR